MSEAQLRSAIAALTILPDWEMEWLGRPVKRYGQRMESFPEGARAGICQARLEDLLYNAFYSPGSAIHLERLIRLKGLAATSGFSDVLDAANHSTGCIDGGWEVAEVRTDTALLRGYGITISAPLPEQMPRPRAGDKTNIQRPKGSLYVSPGFYFVYSGEAMPDGDATVRLYWNVTPQGGVELIDSATRHLCAAGLPFQLKTLSQPSDYRRADAAVLYLPKSRLAEAWEHVARIYDEVSPFMAPSIPAFTKSLAPGVGLAEDPGDGNSFGIDRCRLLSQALVEAHERGKERDLRAEHALELLRARGLDPEKLYLNPGSTDVYDVLETPRRQVRSEGREPDVPAIETAGEIARELTEAALWHGQRCNWIGISSDAEGVVSWSSLAPALYDGSAGIGLFLAEYSAETGDQECARAAAGALRQALKRIDDLRGETQGGFYSGWPGVIYSCWRGAHVLLSEELREQAAQALDRCLVWEHRGPRGDLSSGSAGTLFALSLLDRAGEAERVAAQILDAAEENEQGLSWPSPAGRLAGFSHGASGVAAALLEHHRLHPSPRWRDAVERAFRWEQTVFDAERGNWADLRELVHTDRAVLTDAHYMTSWCHGAPGIALARTRAAQVLGEGPWREEAVTGLGTTRADVAWAAERGGTASLCHSPLGNAEILSWCRDRLGLAPDPIVDQLAARLRIQAAQAGFWLCDFPSVTPPGLMTGLAGVGLFFLRRHNPRIPSALFPEPLA